MRALPPDVVERIRDLRYLDGLTGREVAEIVGVAASTVRRHAPGRPGNVPNAPLGERFLASGLSAYEVARRIGWVFGDRRRGDGARLRRSLGLLPNVRRGRSPSYQRTIDAEVAARIAVALGVEPWEVLP